jgi:hypothetical protein
VQVKVMIIQQRREFFTWKRGRGVNYIVVCIDCDTEAPLEDTFDYWMSPEEAEEYFGRLQDKIAVLAITKFEPVLGGRLRAKGRMTVLSPLKPKQTAGSQNADGGKTS